MRNLVGYLALSLLASASALAQDSIAVAPNGVSSYVANADAINGGCSVIYDTTHAANQGAEITAAANGAATSMSDLVVLAGTDRFVCQVTIEVFTLMATTPFDLTMSFFTDCTTDGSGNSPCGNGAGTLIGAPVTVTGITPPALGTIFSVVFPFPQLDLSGEVDNTVSVSINASRSDVFWRINETPVVGSIPAGEPATSFVERCGSTAANNGCQRNFGVNNNFGMQITAEATPVALQQFSID